MKDFFNNTEVHVHDIVMLLNKGEFIRGHVDKIIDDVYAVISVWNPDKNKFRKLKRMSTGIIIKDNTARTLSGDELKEYIRKCMIEYFSPVSEPVFNIGDKVITQFANSNNFMTATVTEITGESFWKWYKLSPGNNVKRQAKQLLKYPD